MLIPSLLQGKIEVREYQVNVFREALRQNTLIVLPTGLGKTVIAAMVAARVLEEGGRVLFMAPTRPLVQQHYRSLSQLLGLSERECSYFTGEVDTGDRRERWVLSRLIVSTPQVVANDIRSGDADISRFSLLVFDEAHRAVGNYAYVSIASSFLEARRRLVLAMTASPGGDREKVEEVKRNLGIERVIIKGESDPDVAPYVKEIEVETITVALPSRARQILYDMRSIYNDLISKYRDNPELSKTAINRKALAVKIQELVEKARSGNRALFKVIPYLTATIRLDYAIEYMESQGPEIAYEYLQSLEGSEDPSVQRTVKILHSLPGYTDLLLNLGRVCREGVENPKMEVALRLCEQKIAENPASRIIVFTHFRKTSETLTRYLNEHSAAIRAVRFVGQSSRGSDEGMSQREQEEIIQRFRDGDFNVLVATSVAEEGLDIPSTDMVIFYEPVPSEIRSIQRRGRTGRTRTGQVKILLYEGSRDRGYYFSSLRKERRMQRNMEGSVGVKRDPKLDDFS
ncbi:hypothetical protein GCM10007108_02550 [Thermogymnomonas acidicola]|uniref:DEAD/DEAH box helicase n=1 Tax=Thermogymnomonas acidicola TaxID=399579 RepID=A0AA37F8T3_9ARCH|nr:helicase-related protein [Thermogymnomonas acidicola]GGM68001.1 hypothetical protein GCM10007108_02550 [Thermogymnomonas acidicola]